MPTGIYKRVKRWKLSQETKDRISTKLIGRKLSEKTKEKMRETRKLFENPAKRPEVREKISKNHAKYWKGKSPSFEHRKKISEALFVGNQPENESARKSFEYRLWRNAVFARDNWTCQKYGIRGGELVAHHINNFSKYPELRTSITNGITFSKKAHKEFHRKYGTKSNTKEQLNEFLK